MKVHYSSASVEYATPDDFFVRLDDEFRFTLDVCATADNAKCTRFFSRDDDGLRQRWDGIVWCNPPYGSQIRRWVQRGYTAARQGATVVMLIPARTDTSWWHDYVQRADEIRFVRGRLTFGEGRAPFPSCVVVFRRNAAELFGPRVSSIGSLRNRNRRPPTLTLAPSNSEAQGRTGE